MLNQLRVHYPQGCLISEFVTIDHGKYIVRSLVQVDGVTLVTGLAAAECIEMAEDQARLRALALLEIVPTTASEAKETTSDAEVWMPLPATPKPQTPSTSETWEPISVTPAFPPTAKVEPTPVSFPESKFLETTLNTVPSWDTNPSPSVDEFSAEPEVNHPSDFDFPPIAAPQPAFESTSSTLPKASKEKAEYGGSSMPHYPAVEMQAIATASPVAEEPVDFSDIVARTNVELKRLGWTNQQGRDYLVQTYNKRSRQLLSDQELLEFLSYLETQPTPNE
jgi:hypothetical protein